MVNFLLTHGADENIKDADGMSALDSGLLTNFRK
jgi:hypothetical protein